MQTRRAVLHEGLRLTWMPHALQCDRVFYLQGRKKKWREDGVGLWPDARKRLPCLRTNPDSLPVCTTKGKHHEPNENQVDGDTAFCSGTDDPVLRLPHAHDGQLEELDLYGTGLQEDHDRRPDKAGRPAAAYRKRVRQTAPVAGRRGGHLP